MNKNLKRNLSILTLFFALTVIGCGKGEIAGIVGEANKTRIQRAVNSYLLYQRRMLTLIKDRAPD